MPSPISASTLKGYLDTLSQPGITPADASKIYNQLSQQGYGYATLANDLVTGSSLSGQVAKNFMSNYAASLGGALTDTQTNNIEVGMARAYVQTLYNNANTNGGTVSSKIRGHNTYFRRYCGPLVLETALARLLRMRTSAP
jgi:hypothetical protein